MSALDFHYIDLDGVLFEQPVGDKHYKNDKIFAEAVKLQKKIPSVIDRIKEMKGSMFFCTGRKANNLYEFTLNQLHEIFGANRINIKFYPENRGYNPWKLYNLYKLLILEIQFSMRGGINKIYVWEDSIWVIQTIMKYTTIPLHKFVFKYIHKYEGKYYINEVVPEDIDGIVSKAEAELKK